MTPQNLLNWSTRRSYSFSLMLCIASFRYFCLSDFLVTLAPATDLLSYRSGLSLGDKQLFWTLLCILEVC